MLPGLPGSGGWRASHPSCYLGECVYDVTAGEGNYEDFFLTHQHFFSLFLMCNQDETLVRLFLYPRQCSSVGLEVV